MTGRDGGRNGGTRTTRLGLALFLLWWLVLAYLLLSGRYVEFLNPSLWPLLLLGILLAGAFLTALIVLPLGPAIRADAAWIRTGILAVPLLYTIHGSGETLGSDALAQRAIGPMGTLSDIGAVDDDFVSEIRDDRHLDVQRIVRGGKAMLGREVVTLGQIGRDVGEPDGHIVLFRFVVTCCAADARPVGLMVDCGGAPLPEKDAWYEVEGRVEKTTLAGRAALVIRNATLTKAKRPEPPYLYGL
jgi:uncharacterized repeat protein (TIGR03943 family)